MIWPALFWLVCAIVAITVSVRSLLGALYRQDLVFTSSLFTHTVEIAARSRVRLWALLLAKGIAFLLVGLLSVIPHPPIAVEGSIIVGLFMFIAFCLASLTILLSIDEGKVQNQRRDPT